MRASIATMAALLAIAVSGCASSPVTVRDRYVAPAPASNKTGLAATTAAAENCRVHVLTIRDERSDPAFLGVVAGRPVLSPGQGADWISSMLSTGMQGKGVGLSFAPADPSPQHVAVAEVKLSKAWVASVATSMTGTIVLAVRSDDGDSEAKIYRGTSTFVNWTSGEGEIQRLFDDAFEQVLVKLSTDLQSKCSGKAG